MLQHFSMHLKIQITLHAIEFYNIKYNFYLASHIMLIHLYFISHECKIIELPLQQSYIRYYKMLIQYA